MLVYSERGLLAFETVPVISILVTMGTSEWTLMEKTGGWEEAGRRGGDCDARFPAERLTTCP